MLAGVLSMDVAEFTPYVFQILAQLLLYRPNGTTRGLGSHYGLGEGVRCP